MRRGVTSVPALVSVTAGAAVLMTVFELVKELVAPELTKWGSHAVTVAMTTLLAASAAWYVVRREQRAAAALRLNEEDLRITLESIGDGVISTDREGKIVRMNPVALRLTGWTLAEARGRILTEVFRIVNMDTRAPVENPVTRVIATGKVVGLANHTALIARDGTEYAIADAGAPIRNDANELVGVVLSFRDITEQERLERLLVQTQRLDAIGMLAGGVAHDFNNLLTAVMGGAELLRLQVADDDAGAIEQVDLILQATQRATDLTRRLLAFSRQQSVVLAPTDVHEAVRAAIALLERSIDKRIAIVTALSAERSVAPGDLTQLQGLFLNLGVNAAHAMPDGGTLTFASRTVELDESACASSPFELTPGPHIVVEVEDTGHGIAPGILGKIFDPFFTTKKQGAGTGLGLSAVYGTVKQHRGAISVYSEVGKGTIFHLTLPLAGSVSARRDAPLAIVRGSGRILVVEDEEMVRQTAKRILKHLGYDVVLAVNGRDGVEVYDREEGKFDLVLLDMVMPEMNGTDCFRALRQRNPSVAVVLSSGFARDANIDGLLGEGARGFLRKPYTTAELSKTLAEALARPG